MVGGTAAAELNALEASGGDPCRTLKPAMVSFLTSKTEEFHDDVVAWNKAQRALRAAQSRWGSAVYANIASPDINKAMAFSLDATKQLYLENLT